MFVYLIMILLFFMVLFSNMLFYLISLLIMAIVVLTYLVSYGFLRILSLLLILIVYLGAIMILIGYICAVVPNFDLSPSHSYSSVLLFLRFSLLMCYIQDNLFRLADNRVKLDTLVSFFFREWGFFAFFTIVFILFLTLLIVTSQYSSPQGPFRSI